MPDIDPVALFQFIKEFFDMEGLKTLCFQLYVPFDDLEGRTREAKARELIGYMQRVGRLPDLTMALARERAEQYRKTFGSTPQERPKRKPRTRDPRQVFISHAHQDGKFAHQLAGDLRDEGFNVWIAPDSIALGERWVEAINRALQESGIFLLVSTPDAVDSQWVQDETDSAIELANRRLLRFILLDVKEADAPPLWTIRQHVSFRRNYESGLKQLLAALQEPLNSSSFVPTVPGTEQEREVLSHTDVRVWGWVIGLVVLAALIVGANSLLRRSNNDGEPDAGTPDISQTIEQDAESISQTQAVVDVTEDTGPTQRPTARIVSIPTPVPTLIPIQSWTNESEFSVAQGWDILVDADGESGFEDGSFFLTNKKQNLLYISLWDALGGNINDAVISVDLIEPGESEAPNAAGLVFGWGPDLEDSTFAFLLAKDGGCEFRQESNNRWTRVSQGQTSNFNQQKESHTVSVVIRDGHAYGFVDELYCDDNVFPLYKSGYIGVASLSGIDQEDGSKGYFDNARFANLP